MNKIWDRIYYPAINLPVQGVKEDKPFHQESSCEPIEHRGRAEPLQLAKKGSCKNTKSNADKTDKPNYF